LNGEPEEEEKVEFKQGNEDLKCHVASFHLEIRANILVDSPSEFGVEPESDKDHADHGQRDHTRNSNEKGLDGGENRLFGLPFLHHRIQSLPDLIDLYGRVDQHGQIIQDQPDNLNCTLEPQCIPRQDQLHQHGKDEERKVGGNGTQLRFRGRMAPDVCLKGPKDVSFEGQDEDQLAHDQ